MQKKTDIELARLERIDIIRTMTRLKYKLLANRELNETLPGSLAEFDAAIQSGELKQIDISEVLDVTRKNSED